VILKDKDLQDAKFVRAIFLGVNSLRRSSAVRISLFCRDQPRLVSRRGARRRELRKAVAVRRTSRARGFDGANLEKAELHRSLLNKASLQGRQSLEGGLRTLGIRERRPDRGDVAAVEHRARALCRRDDAQHGPDERVHVRDALRGNRSFRRQGPTQAQIDVACGDEKTRLPAGLKRPSVWPCAE
jgi:hypothetical protein